MEADWRGGGVAEAGGDGGGAGGVEGSTVTLTATTGGVGREDDDLTLALEAMGGRLSALRLTEEGVLIRSATATTTAVAGGGLTTGLGAVGGEDAGLYAAIGCRRLTELVHNHHANKAEAVSRGALPAVVAAVASHPIDLVIHVHAARAARSLCFKNEAAKAAAMECALPAALISSFQAALTHLDEYAAAVAAVASAVAAATSGATAPPTVVRFTPHPRRNPMLALGLLEETATTLAALLNRNDEGVAAAIAAGLPDHCTRAATLLPTLKWPPPVKMAGHGGGSGGDGGKNVTSHVVSISAGLTPSQAAKKITFLQMLLA